MAGAILMFLCSRMKKFSVDILRDHCSNFLVAAKKQPERKIPHHPK